MTSESQRKDTGVRLKDEESDASVVMLQRMEAERFSGPLPPPQVISGYEAVLNGSANRILTMAEEQASHRREMESRRLEADIRESRAGMRYAFAISLVIIGCGTSVILLRPSLGGYISGSLLNLIGVASVVNAFLKKDEPKKGDGKAVAEE